MNIMRTYNMNQTYMRLVVKYSFPFFLYLCLAWIFFGKTGSWKDWYLGQGPDPITSVWFLNWWPFSIWKGLNPFLTHFIWFPSGFDLTWATSIPLLSFVALPITVLGGPVLAFNVLTFLAPVLSSWTAFLLANYVVRNWPAAVVAGYFFGFSSYEIGQVDAHLNLSMTCLIPLVVLLCLRRMNNEIARRKFVITMAIVLVAQFCISTELLATLCVLGAVVWGIFFGFSKKEDRDSLWFMAIDVLLASIVAFFIVSPFIFYLVIWTREVPTVINSPTFFSADVLNYFIPTVVNRIGRTMFLPLAKRFTGNGPGQGAYLGLPLIWIMGLFFRDHINRPNTRALLTSILVLATFSLGPWLHVAGLRMHIPLPWIVMEHLPLIRSALPMRFTMYVALCSAIVVALYLAEPVATGWRVWRFVLAGTACLFLAPNLDFFSWTRWPEQAFFTPRNVHRALGTRIPNVIILPSFWTGPGMAWQLDAGMEFTRSGGYVGFTPNSQRSWPIVNDLDTGTVRPDFANELLSYCATHQVDFILIGPGAPPSLVTAIAQLNWPKRLDRGVQVVRVPPASVLHYNYVRGNYWSGSTTMLHWMGHKVDVVTHGESSILTLTGVGRPISGIVNVVIKNSESTEVYHLGQKTTVTIPLQADTDMTITADNTFVPAILLHNGDTRQLSIRLSLSKIRASQAGS